MPKIWKEYFSAIRNRPSVLLRHFNFIFMLLGMFFALFWSFNIIPEAVFGVIGTIDDACILFACSYGIS
jgi:uncharacterized membrane protein YadS